MVELSESVEELPVLPNVVLSVTPDVVLKSASSVCVLPVGLTDSSLGVVKSEELDFVERSSDEVVRGEEISVVDSESPVLLVYVESVSKVSVIPVPEPSVSSVSGKSVDSVVSGEVENSSPEPVSKVSDSLSVVMNLSLPSHNIFSTEVSDEDDVDAVRTMRESFCNRKVVSKHMANC